MSAPFWKTKTLEQMNEAEWESLCDGCGKCCLISIEDEDNGDIFWTDVACKLFDGTSCRCGDYANRVKKVNDCVKLTPANIGQLRWMPKTCAYRLVHEGHDLHWWHPLVSGDIETVHAAGASVRGKTEPEGKLTVRQLVRRITEWPKPQKHPPRPARRKPALRVTSTDAD